MVGPRDVLVAEEQHLPVEQGLPDLRHRLFVEITAEPDAADLAPMVGATGFTVIRSYPDVSRGGCATSGPNGDSKGAVVAWVVCMLVLLRGCGENELGMRRVTPGGQFIGRQPVSTRTCGPSHNRILRIHP